MTDLRKLARVCGTGRVDALVTRPTPEEVERVMGGDYLDVWGRAHRSLRRDYGVTEFHFLGDEGLRCRTVGIQLHRLRGNRHTLSPSEVDVLGDIAGTIPWVVLARTIEEEFGTVPEADEAQSGFIRYRFASNGVEVFTDVGGGLPNGDAVWSIVITFGI